ncbi:MAG: hypothetical protein COV99_02105 [Bacteroidetes bacterium CG12_big_fil_rev_8_21_14_0_65_60_17]|nr:MAG: hypothetical protein COV99_02105 [Bacteroidetes bacterium CG12_big_fil_rev_8_21_14_0_65_60_17]
MVATLPAEPRHRGQSDREARALLERHGPNVLPEKPPPAWWQVGLRQLRSPLIYILIAAAIVSVVIDHARDAAFIGVVVVLNALIGGIQEWKAEKSSQALQHLLRVRARVLRDDEWVLVDAEHVVPGDLVMLESGNRIPADAEVLVSNGLEVDESLLTGESVPVAKGLEVVYAGTTVVRARPPSRAHGAADPGHCRRGGGVGRADRYRRCSASWVWLGGHVPVFRGARHCIEPGVGARGDCASPCRCRGARELYAHCQ